MANPLIMYDLAAVLNPSFEDTTVGSAPGSWDFTNLPAGASAVITTASYHQRGSSEGARSMAMNASSGGDALAEQLMSWAPPDGVLVGFHALAAADTASAGNFNFILNEMNGTSSLGAVVNFTASSVGTSWVSYYGSGTMTSSGDGVQAQVSWDNVTNTGYADYVHIGRALEFSSVEFNALDVQPVHRAQVNMGSAAYEAIQLADPWVRVRGRINRITLDGSFDTAIQAFLGYSGTYRRFAFWLDRSDATNAGHHFSTCLLEQASFRQQHPAGAARYSLDLTFLAPKEWLQQEVE